MFDRHRWNPEQKEWLADATVSSSHGTAANGIALAHDGRPKKVHVPRALTPGLRSEGLGNLRDFSQG